MIDTFSNLYQKISDPKRNQNPENVAKAQELITQKFLNKINQEQDEEIKNVLLSKFTNELISDLVEKTIKANSSDSEVKNKSFGSQPDNLLFSENGDVYIQGLKDIQKKVFGSQMDPNAPLNPIANELNNKIQLFQKEYEEYKRRLANAPTEEERNKIIRAKNAADVTRETVDGAGFIMDITKPNKKSIFGHMSAISKNISRIDSSTRDSYTQAKSNSLTGMLAPIDQLTEFAKKKSRNTTKKPVQGTGLENCLFLLDGGVLDHPVSSLADALVAAHGGNIGFFLDLFQRLFGALCTSGQSLIDIFLGGHQIFLLCDLQQSHVQKMD
jgi:hypothetical protein